MTADAGTEPLLEVRSGKMRIAAIAVAVVLVIGHIGAAIVLRAGGDTGVHLRVSDQIAMVVVGIVVACGALLFARPRLRADADGVSVRNVFAEKHFTWDQVHGITFPHKAPWARIELPDDEYLAVMAVQARDGARAVDALDRFRELEQRYGRAVGHDD